MVVTEGATQTDVVLLVFDDLAFGAIRFALHDGRQGRVEGWEIFIGTVEHTCSEVAFVGAEVVQADYQAALVLAQHASHFFAVVDIALLCVRQDGRERKWALVRLSCWLSAHEGAPEKRGGSGGAEGEKENVRDRRGTRRRRAHDL